MSKYIKKVASLTLAAAIISTFTPKNIIALEKTDYTDLGVYESYSQQDNNVDIVTSNSDLRLEFCTDSMIRIRAKDKSDEYRENENVMVVKYDREQVDYTTEDTQEYLLFKTSALSVRVYKNPIRIEYYEPDNQTPVLKGSDMGYKDNGASRISFVMDSGNETEAFFGLGVSGSDFNYRNKSYQVFTSSQNKHYESPFFISTRGYGIYAHTSFESNFDFTTTPYSITTAGGQLDYYFTYEDSMKDVVSSYNELTGTVSMPPQKALGLMYRGDLENNEDQYKEIINEFRQNEIPVDYIGIEPGWQTATYPCTYVWNTEKFSDPAEFANWTKEQNVELNLWYHPFVHKDAPIRDEIEPYLFDHKTSFATGNGGLAIDFTSQAAKDIFYDYFKVTLGDLGIHSFKIDEVDQFISSDAVLPSGMSGAEYHNIFGTLSQQVIHEGTKKEYGLRTFTYDRGLFTGAQRYPSAAYSDTYDLTEYIRLNVNAGFSGGYVSPELRGDNEGNENLFQRRTQLSMFSAYPLENEWQNGTLPWNRSQKSFDNFKKYDNLRMQLIPYIYTQFHIQSTTGEAFLRPLVLDFENDTNAYNVDQQYMFGQSMMIAPVNSNEDVAQTPVYLPAGTDWYDYNTGLKYTGGKKIEYTSESDVLPIFIKAGSIIPMGEVKQYNTPGKFGNIILDVYGGADGSSYLYEDDGETFDYENGEYAVTNYTTTSEPQKITLNISDRTGNYEAEERTYTVKLHTQNAPTSVTIDGNPVEFIYEKGISTVTFNDDTKAKVIEYQVDEQEEYSGDEDAVLWVDYDKNTEDDFTNASEWSGSEIVKTQHGAEVVGTVTKTFTVDVDKMPYMKVKVNSTTGNWKVKIDGTEILNENTDGLFVVNYKGNSERIKELEVTLESDGKTTFELVKFTGFEKGYYFSSELEIKYWDGEFVFNGPGVLINDTTINTKTVIDSNETPYLRVNSNGSVTVRIDGKEIGTTSSTQIFELPEISQKACDVSVTATEDVILDSIELLSENDVKREDLKTNKSYTDSTSRISTAMIKEGIKIFQIGRNPELGGGWDSVSKNYIVDLEKYDQLKLNITTMENTLYSVKMKNKNGKEIQIKADASVSFNGVIDLSSVSGFKDFVLPGQNEYSVYIWMNDTRNTQEGFVTLSGLEFITSSPSEEYTTYSSTEGWIADSQAEINCRYPGLEIYNNYSDGFGWAGIRKDFYVELDKTPVVRVTFSETVPHAYDLKASVPGKVDEKMLVSGSKENVFEGNLSELLGISGCQTVRINPAVLGGEGAKLVIEKIEFLQGPPPADGYYKLKGTLTANANGFADQTLDKIMDGSFDTFFDTYGDISNPTITFDLGEGNEKTIDMIKFAPRATWAQRLVGGRFQVSVDGTEYKDIYTITEVPPEGQFTEIKFSDPIKYRYVRFVGSEEFWGNFSELEIYTYYSPEPELLKGDVNGDGQINSLDATLVLKADAELIILDKDQIKAADVNGDGLVNSSDAMLILKKEAGLIEEF